MDDVPNQREEITNEELERGERPGVVGPIFMTLFVLTVIAGLVFLPFYAEQEPMKEILDSDAWWVPNVGEYHPLVLHLPIGIVFLVLVMEVFGWLSFGRYRPMTGVALFIAFLTGVFACVTGMCDVKVEGLAHDNWDDDMFKHMWMGIVFVGVLGLAFLAKIWGRRSGARGPIYGILLIGSAAVLVYGAHYGGVKTHGENPVENTLKGFDLIKDKGGSSDEGEEAGVTKITKSRLAFAEVVMPILDSKCLACHSEEAGKDKGELLMDSYENLLIGGESQDGEEYRTLVPGNADESYMIQVLNLPKDDDMHMPPPKKKQMEDHEVEILTWWVNSIAPQKDADDIELKDQTLEEMGAPQNILDAVSKLASPEEVKAMKEEAKAAKAQEAEAKMKAEAQKAAEQKAVEEAVEKLKEDEDFETSLKPLAEDSTELGFNSASLREEMKDPTLEKLAVVGEELSELDLSATSVTEETVVTQLAGMKNLKKLNLSQTNVGDGVLDAVSKLEKLEYLNLYGTQVTDDGIMKLKALKDLKKLYLWQTEATRIGAELLKNHLPELEVFFGVE